MDMNLGLTPFFGVKLSLTRKAGWKFGKGQIRQSLSGYYDIFSERQNVSNQSSRKLQKKGSDAFGRWLRRIQKPIMKMKGTCWKSWNAKTIWFALLWQTLIARLLLRLALNLYFSSNLLDRQLVMLSENEIVPILYFSKADLMDETTKERMLPVFDYYSKYYRTVVSEKNMPDEELVSQPCLKKQEMF